MLVLTEDEHTETAIELSTGFYKRNQQIKVIGELDLDSVAPSKIQCEGRVLFAVFHGRLDFYTSEKDILNKTHDR